METKNKKKKNIGRDKNKGTTRKQVAQQVSTREQCEQDSKVKTIERAFIGYALSH
jgi:hypothetical protein